MTTIVSVRRGDQVVVGGDGQVSLGNTVMKSTARKVNTLAKHGVITGFAGSTADAITLRDLFEQQLDKHQGNIVNAVIYLAREIMRHDPHTLIEGCLIACYADWKR